MQPVNIIRASNFDAKLNFFPGTLPSPDIAVSNRNVQKESSLNFLQFWGKTCPHPWCTLPGTKNLSRFFLPAASPIQNKSGQSLLLSSQTPFKLTFWIIELCSCILCWQQLHTNKKTGGCRAQCVNPFWQTNSARHRSVNNNADNNVAKKWSHFWFLNL